MMGTSSHCSLLNTLVALMLFVNPDTVAHAKERAKKKIWFMAVQMIFIPHGNEHKAIFK